MVGRTLLLAAPLLALIGCTATMGMPAAQLEPASNGFAFTKSYHAHPQNVETATFAAGCFWGVEDAFRSAPGVVATRVGYTGGHLKNPTYEDVCTHTTGHAEAVEVEFDLTKTSYDKMLSLFWSIHDPSLLNRQGPDVGDNYRSAIFTHSDAQQKAALASMARLQATPEFANDRIVTQIVKAGPFYAAEGYHQQYVDKGGVAYCHPRRKGG